MIVSCCQMQSKRLLPQLYANDFFTNCNNGLLTANRCNFEENQSKVRGIGGRQSLALQNRDEVKVVPHPLGIRQKSLFQADDSR